MLLSYLICLMVCSFLFIRRNAGMKSCMSLSLFSALLAACFDSISVPEMKEPDSEYGIFYTLVRYRTHCPLLCW